MKFVCKLYTMILVVSSYFELSELVKSVLDTTCSPMPGE